ncbi:hypothetical protein GGX14DRAFT_569733 [Mycena pura]|uniref:Uncharacterized protein n=1 Tax=Mycena pura TaxID=153505 RepID=A0AAD6Y9Q3_9AGAR|nr:hypothetical protein GGX14DRAFT_569733 [Mycena pura]
MITTRTRVASARARFRVPVATLTAQVRDPGQTESGARLLLREASASALPEGSTDPNYCTGKHRPQLLYRPLPGRLGDLTVPQQHALEKLEKELKA